MSKRWNYKVVEVKPKWLSVNPEQVEQVLAPLGNLGWELVSVTQVATSTYLYLKKEV